MPHTPSRIHPTAVISAEAEIADDVEVGPYVVIEGPVRVGPGCVLRPTAHLIGPLTLGRGNCVHSGAVLGDKPQHLKYADEPTSLEIGDFNTIREAIVLGRAGMMPAHEPIIGETRSRLAAAYVWSLSHRPPAAGGEQ